MRCEPIPNVPDTGTARVDAFLFDAGPVDAPQPVDGGPTCAMTMCGPGERCEMVAGGAACVANTCADLMCTATERCAPAPTGMGNICADNRCTDSLECPADEYCNGTICVTDVCTPGTRSCMGMDVQVCADDGGGSSTAFSCGSEAYFTSTCSAATGTCACEDDWDCPANTVCEVGRCEGTGRAPTCRLPPAPFTSVLPTNEIRWGGTGPGAALSATGSPFPLSAQVSATPLVANLDDDNGDGRIDELDIPEIIFQTYCGTDVAINGVLRAIHGGGPNRGDDFFAVQGATVWHEGDPPSAGNCADGTINSTAALAVADLDGDGVPEIVTWSEAFTLEIHRNTGELIVASAVPPTAERVTGNAAPVIANFDHAGPPEIAVGNQVWTLSVRPGMPIAFADRFRGTATTNTGRNGQGPIACVGNLVGAAQEELVAGSTVYRLPTPPAGVTRRSGCAAMDTSNFCAGLLDLVWDGQTVNGVTMVPSTQRDGFCAIADVLGANETAAPSPTNPLDGTPEVVLVANGFLVVYSGEDGRLRRSIDLGAGTLGGAPNVDDFDGDGFPEIGTAFGLRYIAHDLQAPTTACPAWPTAFTDPAVIPGPFTLQGNPARSPGGACTMDSMCGTGTTCNETTGRCVCLHNGWQRVTEDDSSRVTGSTVFDFNGDGAAELIYNDECYFRIYDGLNGSVLFRELSSSRTRIENPVVADVDNDGNAEIVFCSNNDAPGACSAGTSNNGIEVWGDASDSWVSARRIWNEHAYHVTNVTESAAIPLREPENYSAYAGRSYNTYRSQPRNLGIAPDLTPDRVQTSSPDAACGTLGTQLDIVVRVVNQGDVRVGPDIPVAFFGEWTAASLMEALHADAAGTPLTAPLGVTLEPGRSTLVRVRYLASNNSPGVLPDRIRVSVDSTRVERECVETNNEIAVNVDPGTLAPDLAISVGAVSGVCPAQTFAVTVRNVGSADATGVVVRLYAGDPARGGTPIGMATLSGTIAAGGMLSLPITIDPFPPGAPVTVWGVVDPDDAIAECNDGNNADAADMPAACFDII
jgi:hypothetical protein